MKWKMKDGTVQSIEKLETTHLVNILKMLTRTNYEEVHFGSTWGNEVDFDTETRDNSRIIIAIQSELLIRLFKKQ